LFTLWTLYGDKYFGGGMMDSMMDKHLMVAATKLLEERRQTTLTHLYMVDDMMDEILMLDNPEAMREIASFVKSILVNLEEQV
jgi:hypothetical protein